MYTDRICKAIEVAAIYHENQYRKNPNRKIPYIAHPMIVGAMLSHYGYSEDVVIAGMLHDTIEDTSLSFAEIKDNFGDRVASLVKETTEPDKKTPWEVRKAKYIENISKAGEDAKAISCCDKIHNMKSILSSLEIGSDIWGALSRGKTKQIERYSKMLEIFRISLRKEMVTEYEIVFEKIKNFPTD